MEVASVIVASMSAAVCLRPIARSTSSSMDWGLTLMRSAP